MVTREEMIRAARVGDFVLFPYRPVPGQQATLKNFIADTLQALYEKDRGDLVLYIAGLKRGTPSALNTFEKLFYRGIRKGFITLPL